jgi:hypothetical protein
MGLENRAQRRFLAISCSIAVLATVLLTAGHARAQIPDPSVFSADSIGVFQGGGLDSDVASGATPVTVSSLVANINGTIHSTSETGRGYMKLFGDVSAIGSKGTSGTFGGMFIEFRDVQIRRVDGQPFTSNVNLTLQYFTTMNATWGGGTATTSDRSDFVVTAQISQPETGVSVSATDSYVKMFNGTTSGTPGQESLSASVKGDTTFSLRLSYGANGLSAGTGKFGQYVHAVNIGLSGAGGLSASDALLGTSSTGPVFLLPDGFTVDSPEMGLFDNQWQGIPEPSSLTLLALGLFTLRRQTRR